MKRNARLADIYIKIYNKKPLMMDDLEFLYKYDPECFEKTCRNLFYKEPETKKLIVPDAHKEMAETEKRQDVPAYSRMLQNAGIRYIEQKPEEERSSQEKIATLLDNLKKMVYSESIVQNIKAEKVKELLGNLYMEMLFPHNDRDKYFQFDDSDSGSNFNKKA